jgi:hypothetical protein
MQNIHRSIENMVFFDPFGITDFQSRGTASGLGIRRKDVYFAQAILEFRTKNDSSKGTGLLTFLDSVGRESEISKPFFRGPEGTLGVSLAPSNISLETESATKGGGSLKTHRKQGQKRETPVNHSHGRGR